MNRIWLYAAIALACLAVAAPLAISALGDDLNEPVRPGPDAPIGGQVPPGSAVPPPTQPTAEAGMRREVAPIDEVEVLTLESYPPQYVVRVGYGLPSGCVRPGGYDVQRNGSQVKVDVWILLPADPNVVCTMIYGSGEHRVALGSDFTPGETYTLWVNDVQTSFTAQ